MVGDAERKGKERQRDIPEDGVTERKPKGQDKGIEGGLCDNNGQWKEKGVDGKIQKGGEAVGEVFKGKEAEKVIQEGRKKQAPEVEKPGPAVPAGAAANVNLIKKVDIVKKPKKVPKPLVHREGGRMTPTNTHPPKAGGRQRVVKSVPIVEESGEEGGGKVDTKGKRKAAERAQERVKAVTKVEDEEEDDEEDPEDEMEDGEHEHKEARASSSKTILERVKERDEAKVESNPPPSGWITVDVKERCGQCTKSNTDCHWAPGALRKAGPKACWKCKCRKTGCTPHYRGSGPVQVDLGTPVEDLVQRLVPPASESDGIPRPGIVGEGSEPPTTLGELMIDLLSEIRTLREENRWMKKEVEIIQRTLGTMIAYNAKNQCDVMDRLDGLPGSLDDRLGDCLKDIPERLKDIPEAVHQRIMESLIIPVGVRSPTDIRPPPSLATIAHLEPTAISTTSPRPPPSAVESSPLSPLPLTLAIRDDLPDSDWDEGNLQPETSGSPTTKSTRGLSNVSGSPHHRLEEEPAIPSIVANRTRTKTKVVASTTAGPDDDASSASDRDDLESEDKPLVSKKRKGSTPALHGDQEYSAPRKKVKAAPKAKAPARKGKTAEKKKTP